MNAGLPHICGVPGWADGWWVDESLSASQTKLKWVQKPTDGCRQACSAVCTVVQLAFVTDIEQPCCHCPGPLLLFWVGTLTWEMKVCPYLAEAIHLHFAPCNL